MSDFSTIIKETRGLGFPVSRLIFFLLASVCLSEVQDGWVTSLLATRGNPSPTPPELHGQITLKDPRGRAYAALWGHDLWIYPNKEGFQLGVASYTVPLNVASVKSTGKHSFSLITPYKTFK